MTTAEMQTQVKCIIDNEYGTSAFAVLNSNEGLLLNCPIALKIMKNSAFSINLV